MINRLLVGRTLRLEIAAVKLGRYAADKDAGVSGTGGGGSRRRDGGVLGIV